MWLGGAHAPCPPAVSRSERSCELLPANPVECTWQAGAWGRTVDQAGATLVIQAALSAGIRCALLCSHVIVCIVISSSA